MKMVYYIRKNWIGLLVSGIFGAIISWGLLWFLPSKAVEVSNFPKKELTFTLVDSRNLIFRSGNDANLKVMYNDIAVSNPYITTVNICNSGDYAISDVDFKIPFSLTFTGQDSVLQAQINQASNEHILDEILMNATLEGEKFSIKNFMLNPGESFNIDIISDGKISNIRCDYRMEGIASLNLPKSQAPQYFLAKRTYNPAGPKIFLFLGIALVAFWMCVLFVIFKSYRDCKKASESYYHSMNIAIKDISTKTIDE